MPDAEGERSVDAQQTVRRRLQGTRFLLGVIEIGEDPGRALIEDPPDFGWADPPGSTVEEPPAEPLLERQDMLAHQRRRPAGMPARATEAAALSDLGEDRPIGDPRHEPFVR